MLEQADPSWSGVLSKIGWSLVGLMGGSMGGWLLSIVYDAVAVNAPGDLAVPALIVVIVGAVIASRKRLRLLGFGIILGSLAQAAFFAWLFSSFLDVG